MFTDLMKKMFKFAIAFEKEYKAKLIVTGTADIVKERIALSL